MVQPVSTMTKEQCFARAKALIEAGDAVSLRYACLELRYVLELLLYNKFRFFAKRLPENVLRIWQPPQAFKALEQLEPRATADMTLRVQSQDEGGSPGPWTFIGEHKGVRLKWLRKTYNKLGSYVHISPVAETRIELSGLRKARAWVAKRLHLGSFGETRSFQPRDVDADKLKANLQEMLKVLEPAVQSDFQASMARRITFECEKCSQLVIANQDGVAQTQSATCLNGNCNAEFFMERGADGRFEAILNVTEFPCDNEECEEVISIENRFLDIGFEFSCDKCKSKFVLFTRQWGYGAKQSDQ